MTPDRTDPTNTPSSGEISSALDDAAMLWINLRKAILALERAAAREKILAEGMDKLGEPFQAGPYRLCPQCDEIYTICDAQTPRCCGAIARECMRKAEEVT